jgi:transposase-like protein
VSEGEDVHCEFVKEKYTPEFRQEAARLVLESERPIAYVAEEIGVSATILGRWVKLERERQGSVDGRSDADLRAENAVYAGNLLRPRWIMRSCQKPPPSLWRRDAIGKSELIQLEKANYSIKRMSRLLEVSRSGYYKWVQTQATRGRYDDKRQNFLDLLDKRIHDIWEESDEVYGAPRITAELTEKGIVVNRKTVAKRMRMMGIEGISPREFAPVTTIQSTHKSTLPDLVKRLFDQGQLNRVWMSDISYLRTSEGWLYRPFRFWGSVHPAIYEEPYSDVAADTESFVCPMAHCL